MSQEFWLTEYGTDTERSTGVKYLSFAAVPELDRIVTVRPQSGCSSAWLERYVRDVEVAGSNPVIPTL